MLATRLVLGVLLWSFLTGSAFACADPPRANIRDMVVSAPTIFVFQLLGAKYVRESLGGAAWTEQIDGTIRVIDTLKGHANSFKSVAYTFRGCGSVRMSLGQSYLVATSQEGPELQLWATDAAALDLTSDFYTEIATRPGMARRSPATDIVRKIVGAMPVPDDFPRKVLTLPLEVYPEPLPPALITR